MNGYTTRRTIVAAICRLGAILAMLVLSTVAWTGAAHAAVPNINRTSCDGRTDFLQIYNEGELCFANAGNQYVYITDVYQIHTGNNELSLDWTDAAGHRHNYDLILPWRGWHFDGGLAVINRIEIIPSPFGTAAAATKAGPPKEPHRVARPAINRVDCDMRTDFFRVFNEGVLCFANGGSVNVAIYDVYAIHSGNNDGLVTTDVGSGYPDEIPRWIGLSYDDRVHIVTHIQIF
jgi:hypothetical protein